jgi:hypothetical protein
LRDLIDREDVILLARGAVFYVLGAAVLLVTAAVLGLALRVLEIAGGFA